MCVHLGFCEFWGPCVRVCMSEISIDNCTILFDPFSFTVEPVGVLLAVHLFS